MRMISSAAWATPNVDREVFPIPRSWKMEGRNLGFSMSSCIILIQTHHKGRRKMGNDSTAGSRTHVITEILQSEHTVHGEFPHLEKKQNQIGRVVNGTR